MREVVEQIKDPRARAQLLGQLAGRFAQLRREKSNAVRVRVIREQWERKLAAAAKLRVSWDTGIPDRALFLQRMYLDGYDEAGGRRPASAGETVTAFLLRNNKSFADCLNAARNQILESFVAASRQRRILNIGGKFAAVR